MTPARLEQLTHVALEVAEEAASLMVLGHRAAMTTNEKGRADLVTQYDITTERWIRQRLHERTPDLAIVGEEQGGSASGPTWYIDPIDGTTNFVHGHPFFCISLGVMADGEALVGAVVAPAAHLRWHGFKGGEAFRNGDPCHVSQTATLQQALVATGFHPQVLTRPDDDHPAAFRRILGSGVHGVRICGSAAMDLCLVADGTYDAYWEGHLHAWDTVAGAAIVSAAGGQVTDLKGGKPNLAIGHIAVSNGLIHDALLGLLKDQPSP
jgi:myo-inositol-1(or 4)-monophosphatase